MDTTPKVGLRERKKQETRSALAWAAVRLSVERGFDNVLVEDVASAAGVSARTFNNYFASKAEAVVSRHVDRVRVIAEGLRQRPAAEPLWDAVTGAVLSQFGGGRPEGTVPDQGWTAGVQLMMAEPAVQAELLRGSRAAEHDLALAVAERVGVDVGRDIYPSLVATTTGAALDTAIQFWLSADQPVSLTTLLRDALKQIAAGLPDPSA
jgi:AcrR family transcriptional regulator